MHRELSVRGVAAGRPCQLASSFASASRRDDVEPTREQFDLQLQLLSRPDAAAGQQVEHHNALAWQVREAEDFATPRAAAIPADDWPAATTTDAQRIQLGTMRFLPREVAFEFIRKAVALLFESVEQSRTRVGMQKPGPYSCTTAQEGQLEFIGSALAFDKQDRSPCSAHGGC